MERLLKPDAEEPTEEGEELTFENVREELEKLGGEYNCPELALAYDAVLSAIKVVEEHPESKEIMSRIFERMRPLISQGPALMMKMGMFGQ